MGKLDFQTFHHLNHHCHKETGWFSIYYPMINDYFYTVIQFNISLFKRRLLKVETIATNETVPLV